MIGNWRDGSARRPLILCAVLPIMLFAPARSAHADGQAIVDAAQAMQSQGYPYCFAGGTTNGPSSGSNDSDSDGEYSDCRTTPGKVGFDCTGLTLYAVYQGTGKTSLTHNGSQAAAGGGQVITSPADLQPGDVVYFDRDASHGLSSVDHSGIYVGQSGGQPMVLSAVSEQWGIRTESIDWYASGGLHFVGAVRHFNTTPAPGWTNPKLTPVGLGPLRFGMTAGDASTVSGVSVDLQAGVNGCADLTLSSITVRAQLMTFDGKLAFILVGQRGIETSAGIRVGDSLKRLQQRYGKRLRHGRSGSLGFASRRLFVDQRSGGTTHTLEFDLNKNRVISMSAGSRHTIETFGECA